MRKLQTLVAAAVAVTLLAGCGGEASPGASGEASSAPAGGSGDTLVVYTNSNGEGRGDWLTQKAGEAGFKIEIVGAGGADATNKLIAEKNNPIADVAFGLNNMYFSQVKAADALEPYEPAWAGEVDTQLADGETYWPLVKQAILLGYNSDKFSTDAAPKDWTDLWTKDEFKARYERVTGLGTATAQLVFAGILSRYRDDSGDLGISDEGWKQVEQYFQNGSPAVAKTDLFARIASGEVDMGQMPSSIIADREKSFKVNVETVMPSVGVPLAVEQIALVKGTKKKDQAQKFIDWFGSADVQGQFAKQFNAMPVNKSAQAQANPEVVDFFADLKQQDIDWEFVQENMGAWVEKIELEYMT
ncbi:extracellular solute-binding protein family 1 [Pseudarthrobacter chlorophenolicus A6]|uniref:Extracellular solute-binding protein family 1 n=1 Tax=Pseudarthrobacter chlorophenolicus (strain ATCC 700700 / DSM 12829 / CIP 107037 / JCM 12360 / KCTC 9906 / NCIMB 13794 / A6) TaxID=452863 RepID=B8H7Y3_PSECP|nr:extracellular solute-binding protein [Pseudarthrobacter chlorophenolicus]ACL41786.1 extracellular solute-binding protein family 1 [Pseudarthrobacter chlorophenolicus A6]SDQ58486.1 iron(III) transport system substrate-binding protein [Pseudarthrobacter chlorophenolicus]